MRLNRYLSLCGLGSRRGCESLILDGAVSINGSYIRDLGTQVGEDQEVRVHGKIVRPARGTVLALHKPKGYVCSRGDTHDRLTVYDLLPPKYEGLHHVGRLDKESEGLILMTNRGDLSHRLLHPSQGVEKEYEVVVDKEIGADVCAKLVKGMMTPEGHARAERAWTGSGGYRVHIVLKQGLKRQIRHMLFSLGYEVERLIRARLGWLQLRGLAKGGWRELTEAEVERFFSAKDNARPPAPRSPSRSKPAAAAVRKSVSSPGAKPAARPAKQPTARPAAKRTAKLPAKKGASRRPRH